MSAMRKSFHVTTFGCQMNVHDSERMRGMLASLGYEEAESREEADLILFNTCSIRESADSRFIAHLGEAKRLKGEDPERVVGVGGCWAQSVKEEVFERFPFVDVAFGPGQIHKLAEFLNSDSLTAQGYFEFEDFSGHLPSRREREFQGWLQISQGCNCVCSYCIVPSTRGREVSRDPVELVAEAEALAADGVREVTLLGQNVNSYGRDLPKRRRIGFAELLGRIDAVEGIDRIRYTSPHPKDMKEDVIRAHAELPSLCEQIHLPLQSGSSAVLKRMRRTYDRERYLDRVALIREHVPDCAITTDIIVGFPGETEADFERDAGSGRGGRLRRRLHLRLLARGAKPRRRRWRASCRTRSRSSGWSGWSRWSSGAPPSAPSASSAARWRSWSKAPAAPTRPGCAAAPATTRRSTSTASPSPGRWSRSRSTGATSQTLSRRRRAPALAPPLSDRGRRRDLRADRGRQDRGGDRAGGAAARARGGPGGDLLRRAAGLRGPGDADRRRQRRRAGAARAPAARLRPGHRAVLGRRLHAAGPRRGRRRARRRTPADRGRRHRPLPARRARRALAATRCRRTPRTRSCGRPRPATRPRSSASTWTAPGSTSGSTPGSRRSSPPAPPRRRAAPTRSAPRAPPARRSASTSCSPATSSR